MKIVGWLEVIDGFGRHVYTVSHKNNRGFYYLTQKTLYGNHRMRYNANIECVEELLDNGTWDIYTLYVFSAHFIPIV